MNGDNPRGIFGQSFACPCGRSHSVQPNEVLYAPRAVAHLPEVCGRYAAGRRCAVLMDTRTRDVAGRSAADALSRAGWDVRPLL
ncbi:MAG TPA: hypothetical protein VM031_03150, partial [Phycisphaerae bacterium]|nr:hypothetical protein [Phycisphaerae bacterium]